MQDKIEIADAEHLKFFSSFIERETGIIYSDHNSFQLKNRLEEISKLLGEADIRSLHATAQKGITGSFRQLLLDVATNNETSFFRDPKVFTAIEKEIVPKFLAAAGPLPDFRIWSAASSTGQEAITLAILLEEYRSKSGAKFEFRIVGSDISERVLTKARAGLYTQLEVQRGLSAPQMIKYFSKDENDRWQVSPKIQAKTEFRRQNLKEPFQAMGRFDLILCRNVLIYQNVPSKTEVIARLSEQLNPGGFLVLGSGESLIGLSTDFKQVAIDGAVVYQKNDASKAA
jgi:chemotaxis protein methyltransferase CheR